jgi:hypothetical protein
MPRGQRDGSLRPYSRFSRQEPSLFYQVAPQLYSTRLSGPRSRPTRPQRRSRTQNSSHKCNNYMPRDLARCCLGRDFMPYVLSPPFNSVATDLIVTGNNTCRARVDVIAGFVCATSITTLSVHSYHPLIIKFCSRITTGLYGVIADSTHHSHPLRISNLTNSKGKCYLVFVGFGILTAVSGANQPTFRRNM